MTCKHSRQSHSVINDINVLLNFSFSLGQNLAHLQGFLLKIIIIIIIIIIIKPLTSVEKLRMIAIILKDLKTMFNRCILQSILTNFPRRVFFFLRASPICLRISPLCGAGTCSIHSDHYSTH